MGDCKMDFEKAQEIEKVLNDFRMAIIDFCDNGKTNEYHEIILKKQNEIYDILGMEEFKFTI
jgi:hypothetical protein